MAKELGFDLLLFPGALTHILQPMDDLFGALKRHYYGLIKIYGESDEGPQTPIPVARKIQLW